MNEYISLEDAVIRLNGAGRQASVQQIIEGDRQRRIPLFWRNSRQIFTRVFVPDGREGAGVGCAPARLLRVSVFDRDRLEVEESVVTTAFDLLDEDLPMLQTQGLDHLDLMRWAEEPCVVSRASLRVRATDVDAMVVNVAASGGRASDDVGMSLSLPYPSFPLVKAQRIKTMFPDGDRWETVFKSPGVYGLHAVKRGLYDPLEVGLWWLATRPRKGWTRRKILETLAREFPDTPGAEAFLQVVAPSPMAWMVAHP